MTFSNPTSIPLHSIYLLELREHALTLLWLGYSRMKAMDFTDAEEDVITGELVREMKSAIEADKAPLWTEHYSVSEQVRANIADRFGKRRPIVDVELERHKRGMRPRFRFEAKRLGVNSGLTDYIGAEGLGAFLDGYYDRTHNEVGMIGFVQRKSESYWVEKMEKSFISPAHSITPDGSWRRLKLEAVPFYAFQTIHADHNGLPLTVVHLFLNFSSN